MSVRTLSVVSVLFSGILAGCSKDLLVEAGRGEGTSKPKDTTHSAKNKSSGSEAEARAVLNAALDKQGVW